MFIAQTVPTREFPQVIVFIPVFLVVEVPVCTIVEHAVRLVHFFSAAVPAKGSRHTKISISNLTSAAKLNPVRSSASYLSFIKGILAPPAISGG